MFGQGTSQNVELFKAVFKAFLGRCISYRFVTLGVVAGLGAAFAMSSMALLSFYLVSAAHRAFRLNRIESGLMMIAAVIVLLSLTPVGDVLGRGLPNCLRVGTIAQWILSTPNTAVQKAVLFGVCGGAFVAAMRQWLSMGKEQ